MSLVTHRVLTDAEMFTVKNIVAARGEVAGVEELWSVLLGVQLEDHPAEPGELDPTAVAIPESQWKEICQAMIDNPGHTGLAGGTLMNSGPSAYTD